MSTQIRLPIEPLERWFAVAHSAADGDVHAQEELEGRPSARRLGEACGVPFSVIGKWRKEGVPYWAADEAATRLGWHPNAFWDNWDGLVPSGVDNLPVWKPPISPIVKAKALSMLADGHTIQYTADQLGVSFTAVRNWRIATENARYELPEFFIEIKRAALVESWRLRAECHGSAAQLAHQMLTPDTGETAA